MCFLWLRFILKRNSRGKRDRGEARETSAVRGPSLRHAKAAKRRRQKSSSRSRSGATSSSGFTSRRGRTRRRPRRARQRRPRSERRRVWSRGQQRAPDCGRRDDRRYELYGPERGVHGQDEGRKCRLRLHHAEGGLSRSRSGSICHQDVGARVNHTRRIGYGWLHGCMDLVLAVGTRTVTRCVGGWSVANATADSRVSVGVAAREVKNCLRARSKL